MSGFSRTWGEGGETALLLHCTLAHSGAWQGVAKALSNNYCLVAPDLLGHGRTPDGDRAGDYHDQVTAQALAYLPETPTHVVGHSFGASVALRLAIEHPDRVRSLTLIEPVLFAAAPASDGQKLHSKALADMVPLMEAGEMEAATRLFLSEWGSGVAFDDMPASQARYMVERIWIVAASHNALHHDSARLLPRLSEVKCPVLLIEGGASPAVIGDIQSALAEGLAQSTRCNVEGAGHMVPITHPTEVAEAMRAHFAGSKAARTTAA